MPTTETASDKKNKLLKIIKDLSEDALDNVIGYANRIREKELTEGDELDRIAEERFREVCLKRGIDIENLDDEEIIRIASDLIHKRREQGRAQSSS